MKATYTPAPPPKPEPKPEGTITVEMSEADAIAIAHALCGLEENNSLHNASADAYRHHGVTRDIAKAALQRFRDSLTDAYGGDVGKWL